MIFNISNLNNHLDSDEKIVLFFRPSRIAYSDQYTIWIVLAILGIFFSGYSSIGESNFLWQLIKYLSMAIILVSIILLIRLEYRIWSRKYALTTERLLYSRGIFSEIFKSSSYRYITDIKLEQSFWDKLFNTGSLTINTAGTDRYEIRYRKVRDPIGIKKKMNDLQTKRI